MIFDIKEFAVYDGPGIRTTVFFKGCPLSCRWCHNPEGLRKEPEIWVNAGSCTHCGKCRVPGCSKETSGVCSACGRCVYKCPNGFRRIIGVKYTPSQLSDVLAKQAYFLRQGGVTFSGGEPTMQSDFLLEAMPLIPFHRALQTCGFCKPEVFSEILGLCDFVLYDIKLADDKKHKEYTGVSNDVILENLERLKSSGVPFIARTPIIAGVNDDSENLRRSVNLVKDAPGLVRYELLPYNGAAGGKYAMVGRKYGGREFRAPEKIDLSEFSKAGVECRIL